MECWEQLSVSQRGKKEKKSKTGAGRETGLTEARKSTLEGELELGDATHNPNSVSHTPKMFPIHFTIFNTHSLSHRPKLAVPNTLKPKVQILILIVSADFPTLHV